MLLYDHVDIGTPTRGKGCRQPSSLLEHSHHFLHGATKQEKGMQEQQQGQRNVALISFVCPSLFTFHGADKNEEGTEAMRGCVSLFLLAVNRMKEEPKKGMRGGMFYPFRL